MAGHGGGSVERILENLRQYQLTKSLGQVVCDRPRGHGEVFGWLVPCPNCKAVV